jgi:hypothetical protein
MFLISVLGRLKGVLLAPVLEHAIDRIGHRHAFLDMTADSLKVFRS